MRLLHGLAKIHATFDGPNLVSQAGLVTISLVNLRQLTLAARKNQMIKLS